MKTILTMVVLMIVSVSINAKTLKNEGVKNVKKQRLAVVWSSGDPEVADKVCFMYTHNARLQGWFDEVVLIVWGPSSKLLSENKELQQKVRIMIRDGVKVEACVACANMYGVADQIREIGIDVKGMGSVLSNYLKDDWKVITF
jgi:hypothetical protein